MSGSALSSGPGTKAAAAGRCAGAGGDDDDDDMDDDVEEEMDAGECTGCDTHAASGETSSICSSDHRRFHMDGGGEMLEPSGNEDDEDDEVEDEDEDKDDGADADAGAGAVCACSRCALPSSVVTAARVISGDTPTAICSHSRVRSGSAAIAQRLVLRKRENINTITERRDKKSRHMLRKSETFLHFL